MALSQVGFNPLSSASSRKGATQAKTPAACRRILARLLILLREQENCIIDEPLKLGSVFGLHVTVQVSQRKKMHAFVHLTPATFTMPRCSCPPEGGLEDNLHLQPSDKSLVGYFTTLHWNQQHAAA